MMASEKQFGSAIDLIGPSAQLFRRNIWTYIFLSLAPLVLTFIVGILVIGALGDVLEDLEAWTAGDVVLGVVSFAATVTILFLFDTALAYATLVAARGKKTLLRDTLKAGWKFVWKLTWLYFITGIATLLGLVALIVPGIILIVKWAPRLAIAPFVMFEEDLGPIETFKRTKELAEGAGLWGVIGVLSLVSVGITIVFVIISGLFDENSDIQLVFSALESIAYAAFITIPALRYVQIRTAHNAKPAVKEA